VLQEIYQLGTSGYQLLSMLLSSTGLYWTGNNCLASSKLMGNSWEPNFKTLPSLCYLYLFVSQPDTLIGAQNCTAQLQFSFWKDRKLLSKDAGLSSWRSEVGRGLCSHKCQ
jgi:hypothetical protein